MTRITSFLPVFLGVISDFRVIATLVAFILVIMIASFIANYTKKPPRPKKANKPAPAPKPQETEKNEESEADDEE